eukprot:scaffold24667_cov31-Prasinocladus_malaysianus.AAC.1
MGLPVDTHGRRGSGLAVSAHVSAGGAGRPLARAAPAGPQDCQGVRARHGELRKHHICNTLSSCFSFLGSRADIIILALVRLVTTGFSFNKLTKC